MLLCHCWLETSIVRSFRKRLLSLKSVHLSHWFWSYPSLMSSRQQGLIRYSALAETEMCYHKIILAIAFRNWREISHWSCYKFNQHARFRKKKEKKRKKNTPSMSSSLFTVILRSTDQNNYLKTRLHLHRIVRYSEVVALILVSWI